MKVVIAGSRGINDYEALKKAVINASRTFGEPTSIISGTAQGADRMGERWAAEHGVPVVQYPAEWRKYGRGAGMIRNHAMAQDCDYAIILWDGKSKGTRNMVKQMRHLGKPVHKTVVTSA